MNLSRSLMLMARFSSRRRGISTIPYGDCGPQVPPRRHEGARSAPHAVENALSVEYSRAVPRPKRSRLESFVTREERKLLGLSLIEAGFINRDQLNNALRRHRKTGDTLGYTLLKL